MICHLNAFASNTTLVQIAVRLACVLIWGFWSQVQAAGNSDVAVEAHLNIAMAPMPGVEVSSFVSDDGLNPFTTYASRDPDGIAGSFAVANGQVSTQPGHVLTFSMADQTRAEGAPDPLIEVAWAQTTVGGGFLVVNALATDVQAAVSVTWSWTMVLSAIGSGVDLGLGQVQMVLSIDGSPFQVLADALHAAPGEPSQADGGTYTTTLIVPMLGSREVSLDVFALSLAQATVVPELGTLGQVLAGIGLLGALKRRRHREEQAEPIKHKGGVVHVTTAPAGAPFFRRFSRASLQGAQLGGQFSSPGSIERTLASTAATGASGRVVAADPA